MTNLFIKKPIFSFVLMILAVLIGVISIVNTPKQLMPDIDAPIISVTAVYPGASSEEVLQKITEPLEANLGLVQGLDTVQSTTSESVTSLLMVFDFEADIDKVENEVNSAVNKLELPKNATVQVLKFNTADLPIIQLALSTEELTNEALGDVKQIRSELLKVDGVSSVDVTNTNEQTIEVHLDKNKIDEAGLTVTSIANALQANNFSIPITGIKDGESETTARFEEKIGDAEELKALVVGYDALTNKEVLLSEASNIESVYKTKDAINRLDAQEAVVLSIKQKSTANTADVSSDVQERLDELLSEDYDAFESTVVFDQGEFTTLAISNILMSVLMGGLFAILTLIAFLRSITASTIISISIPFSLMVTFIFFYYFDLSLNIMTLGGLALAVGMLVDNAIVVIENIYRHLNMGKDRKQAALEGTKEVAGAIVASTITTVAVFLPLTFSSGIVRILFTEFALSVSVALLSSLIVALTVIPTLSSLMLKVNPKADKTVSRLTFFANITKLALRNRIVTMIIVTVLFVAGALGIAKAGMELFPATDQGVFMVSFEEKENVTLNKELLLEEVEQVETFLREQEEIKNVLVTYDAENMENVLITGVMKPISERSKETAEYIEDYKKGLDKKVTQKELTWGEQQSMGIGGSNALTFSVDNKNEKLLKEDVLKINEKLNGLEDAVLVESNLSDELNEYVYSFNEEELKKHGLTAIGVSSEINVALNPTTATNLQTKENGIVDVLVQINPENLDTIQKINGYQLATPSGEKISLNQIAVVEEKPTAPTIIRSNGSEKVDFTVEYKKGVELSVFNTSVEKAIEELELDGDTKVSFTGDAETLQESLFDLILMLMASIVLIYLVIAAQFESFKQPLIIMVSIPLVVIGIGASLFLTSTPMSLIAMIGVIILTGVVVNNAIVLIDYINQLRKKGMETMEALIKGVETRTRPILITTITTVLGLIPVALGLGEGAELQQPMAIVIIGGLLSSTFLTLVIIPVVYSLFVRNKKKNKKKTIISSENYYFIKKEDLDEKTKKELETLINNNEDTNKK